MSADDIIDQVFEAGPADFVIDLAAELPLQVIAELLGVPHDDRHKMFDWSNRMIGQRGSRVPGLVAEETQPRPRWSSTPTPTELFAQKRVDPHDDLMSVLTDVELDGRAPRELELELFFLLLTVAGNETTRNLMSGAMHAFSQYPDQWQRLRDDRTLLPTAVEEMLRFVTPVMNFRRTATDDVELGGTKIKAGDKVVFFHVSANRDETVFDRIPTPSTSAANPTPTSPSEAGDRTSAWAPTWPAWRSA